MRGHRGQTVSASMCSRLTRILLWAPEGPDIGVKIRKGFRDAVGYVRMKFRINLHNGYPKHHSICKEICVSLVDVFNKSSDL